MPMVDDTQKKLDDFLDVSDVPDAGSNAHKEALNMAMAEFESELKSRRENKITKTFQGLFSFLRLTDRPTDQRRENMPFEKKKLIYGGMATACVSLLAISAAFYTQPDLARDVLNRGETPAISASGVVGGEQTITTAPEGVRADLDSNVRPQPEPVAPKAVAQEEAEQLAPRSRDKKLARTLELSGAQNESFAAQDMAAAPPSAALNAPVAGRMAVTKGMPQIVNGAASDKLATVHPMVDDVVQLQHYQDVGRDQFEDFDENPVFLTTEAPVSTFSIDVDTSSYSFMRRQLNRGVLPQKNAVRLEEMINYFDYDYPLPETKEAPFKPSVAVVPSPWANGKKLVHIGIKGYDIAPDEKPRSNLVFLLDVSGSMNNPDKLPLVKQSMGMLLEKLDENDTVSIAVYAGAAGTALEPTPASEKAKIMAALDNLRAGGSTAGAQGIKLAYQLAEANFQEDAVNRVILATDGDFNVGITDRNELKDFIERKRDTGIFLSVLGFGQGNLNDHMMQQLAQNGNGVAAYIDSVAEARKVLVEEASSTLFPIAKDVKIQVEFNPDTVSEYRLIGYETRALNREDFNNDAVDAGDIGAGHAVTAIYEITPVGGPNWVDELRYGDQAAAQKAEADAADKAESNEYAFLKIRYKLPDEDTSKLITTPITYKDDVMKSDEGAEYPDWLIRETGWAAAVAGFGQILKGGKFIQGFTYDDVIHLAQQNKGTDEFGYRSEFIQLVRAAKSAAAMQAQP